MESKKKRTKIMKKNANEIMMLQYRIKRYQAMGNRNNVPAVKWQTSKTACKAGYHVIKTQSILYE